MPKPPNDTALPPVKVTPLTSPSAAELADLSELALRSKAYWGYDAAFMEACRAVMTLSPDKLAGQKLAVTRREDAFAGMATVYAEGTAGYLEMMFVDPTAIGRGHGAALLAWAIETLRADGARFMTIEADPHAAAFYERAGARQIGTVPSEAVAGRELPLYRLDL